MRYATLAEWLAFQERLHPVGMDLTLERIALVADRLGLRGPGTRRTVIVAGTNGKGTVTTRTAALLQAQGLNVGLFTSPHLLQYNERIRLNGRPASDADLCRAFEAIDQARGNDSLTYFEFAALAAAWLFREARVDVQVLEVGLGGRLDAVNIWDADVAAVTAVDLDHQAWLGDSREVIGHEKAGIMRAGRPWCSASCRLPRVCWTMPRRLRVVPSAWAAISTCWLNRSGSSGAGMGPRSSGMSRWRVG